MVGKHRVGDYVTRLVNVFDETSELLTGVVAKGPYAILDSKYGFYPELYDVLWKQKPKIGRGYLWWGITAAKS